MKTLFHVLPLILATPLPSFAAPPPAPEGFRWVLDDRFSDEFDGETLDAKKWLDHFPGWLGRHPAKFVPSAITVAGGFLRISAGVLPSLTARSISGAAHYGYYEARMKASAISMSSTFWLNGGQRQEAGAHALQEIDIVETIGAPHPEPEWRRTGIDR